MKTPTYNLETVADLARVVTLDNVDELAEDLKAFLNHIVIAKGLIEATGHEFDPEQMGVHTLSWTPDGKRQCHTLLQDAKQSGTDNGFHIHSKPSELS